MLKSHDRPPRLPSTRVWPRAWHQGQTVADWVDPFLEFTSDRFSIRNALLTDKQLAALLAVIHGRADQFNGLFAGHS